MITALALVGNPSSVHAEGRAARRVVEGAREAVAGACGLAASGVVLTAGGTEACNLGVLGLGAGVTEVITTRLEHPAVERAVATLGVPIRYVEVSPTGDVDARALAHASRHTLIAMQLVNHETGHELPVAEISLIARARGARLFVDATQALGKRPLDFGALGACAVAVASHKVGGPRGAGALLIEPGLALEPRSLGGAQEHGLRGGTQDVVSLAGFAAALADVPARIDAMPRVAALRDRLEAALVALGAQPNAPTRLRAATVTNVSVPRWRSDWLVPALDAEGLACSSGAACSSGVVASSPVIEALFPDDPARARTALRLSLGVETTPEDVDAAIAILARVIPRAA